MHMRARSSILLLLLIIAAGVSLRTVHLDADGPTRFPNGLTDPSPIEDEAGKGFAARSRILFGAWSPSAADDYRFWEVLSPVWTWMLYFWFKVIGPGIVSFRLFSVFWSAVSIAVIYLVLAKRSRPAALAAAVLVAVNFYAVIFGRLGLLETMLNALLLGAFAFQVSASKKPVMLFPAALCWLSAYLVKQSAITYLPVLLGGAALMFASGGEGSARQKRVALVAVVLVIIAAFSLLLWPDYRLRTIMNARHALDYRPDQTYMWMQVNPGRTWQAIVMNITGGFWRGYILMMPIAGTLALAELFMIGRDLIKRRPLDRLRLLAALWWLCARASLTLQGQAFPRFYLIQLPSAAILAALALERVLSSQAPARKQARFFTAAALILAALIHLAPWLTWVREYPRDLSHGSAALEEMIGPGPAVVVGKYAGPLCFDTGYKYYYLKSVFNRLPEQVQGFGITHLLLAEDMMEGEDLDPAVRRLKKFLPGPYDSREEIGRIILWPGQKDEKRIILFRLGAPGP